MITTYSKFKTSKHPIRAFPDRSLPLAEQWVWAHKFVALQMGDRAVDFVRVEYPGGAVIVRRKPH